MKSSTARIIFPFIGLALFLAIILTLHFAFKEPFLVDSRVLMTNGLQGVMFVTSDKVEERLKGLRQRFRIVSIDNDDGLFTIVFEMEVPVGATKITED